MPVVWRGDVDHVDVFAIQDPPVIVGDHRLTAGMSRIEARSPAGVHIGDRHEVDPLLRGVEWKYGAPVAAAKVAHDERKPRRVVVMTQTPEHGRGDTNWP